LPRADLLMNPQRFLKKKIRPHYRIFRRGLGRTDAYLTQYSTKEVNGSNVSL
jgi:hypothetical protein